MEAVVDVDIAMAEYFLSIGKRPEAIQLYRENIAALNGSAKPSAIVSLALNYELLAAADKGQAADYDARAFALWIRLRDTHPLQPRYAARLDPR